MRSRETAALAGLLGSWQEFRLINGRHTNTSACQGRTAILAKSSMLYSMEKVLSWRLKVEADPLLFMLRNFASDDVRAF